MISEYLMRTGGWELSLQAGTPREIREAFDYFGHVAVCPAPLGENPSRADILAASRFTGVMRKRRRTSEVDTWSGPSITMWVGEERGRGTWNGSGANLTTARTMAQWVSDYISSTRSNGITDGGGSSPTVTTVTIANAYQGGRSLLEDAALATGNEWRVTPQGTFVYGTALFATSEVLLYEGSGVSTEDGYPLVGIGAQIDVTEDRDEYCDGFGTWWVDTNSQSGGLSLDSDRFRDFGGSNYMKLQKKVETSPGAKDPTVVLQQRNWSTEPRRAINVRADVFDVGRYLTPGDTVYVYAPKVGLEATSGALRWGGITISPLSLRLRGMRWPVASGMSVYAISNDAATITNLTPYVAMESGASELFVDAYPRSLMGVGGRADNATYQD